MENRCFGKPPVDQTKNTKLPPEFSWQNSEQKSTTSNPQFPSTGPTFAPKPRPPRRTESAFDQEAKAPMFYRKPEKRDPFVFNPPKSHVFAPKYDSSPFKPHPNPFATQPDPSTNPFARNPDTTPFAFPPTNPWKPDSSPFNQNSDTKPNPFARKPDTKPFHFPPTNPWKPDTSPSKPNPNPFAPKPDTKPFTFPPTNPWKPETSPSKPNPNPNPFAPKPDTKLFTFPPTNPWKPDSNPSKPNTNPFAPKPDTKPFTFPPTTPWKPDTSHSKPNTNPFAQKPDTFNPPTNLWKPKPDTGTYHFHPLRVPEQKTADPIEFKNPWAIEKAKIPSSPVDWGFPNTKKNNPKRLSWLDAKPLFPEVKEEAANPYFDETALYSKPSQYKTKEEVPRHLRNSPRSSPCQLPMFFDERAEKAVRDGAGGKAEKSMRGYVDGKAEKAMRGAGQTKPGSHAAPVRVARRKNLSVFRDNTTPSEEIFTSMMHQVDRLDLENVPKPEPVEMPPPLNH